ncbi:hypothetical protein EVAR_88320_1 [Eumeta japonica]|uniref:Uncharacterized protein n=1 Tax=Eumeta variegata TaxID=151549 RepID=A0A4C1VL62_EUMVA|nr:hypothetical protein EVAR_88320_1 [Eumeta japonica]
MCRSAADLLDADSHVAGVATRRCEPRFTEWAGLSGCIILLYEARFVVVDCPECVDVSTERGLIGTVTPSARDSPMDAKQSNNDPWFEIHVSTRVIGRPGTLLQ